MKRPCLHAICTILNTPGAYRLGANLQAGALMGRLTFSQLPGAIMRGTPHLQIRLLGDLELWRNEKLLSSDAWPDRKTCQLLKLLVTFRHRVVATDELIEALWSKLDPSAARNSLWVAISQLRRVLEPELTVRGDSSFILTEPPGYRFDSAGQCSMDVDAFLAQVRSGQEQQLQGKLTAAITAYTAAAALYRGDYLERDPYEEWAIPPRERLRETFLDLLRDLAACHLALGRYQDALSIARRALELEPCRESVWRLVMEAHYRAGEQDQALRAYERCREALSRELGVSPLAETTALHTRILQNPLVPVRAPPAALPPALALRLPFVGRSREWPRLCELLQQVMEGQGQVVLITGEPGIGKTRLLEELAALAIARGARVLSGCGYEIEQHTAYAPFCDALRPLLEAFPEAAPPCPPSQLATLAELLPELRQRWRDLPPYSPLPPEAERARLLTALAQVILHSLEGRLEDRPPNAPLVVLLDDLHWADPSSLELFAYLARQTATQPLLLAGAYRSTRLADTPSFAALRQWLLPLENVTEIGLSPLDKEDISLLLRILGKPDSGDPLAHWLYQQTEGQPFFLAEMLRTLEQDGMAPVTRFPDSAVETCWLISPRVQNTILGRLARLDPENRALLDHAAIIGREFHGALLARLLEWTERSLVERADRLCARGFLRPRSPDCYQFCHELVRRAVYEALSDPRRRYLHRQLAEVLLAQNAPAGTIATHYAASDRPWLALEALLAAAGQATQLIAYEEALAWYQQALSIVETYPQAAPSGFRTRLYLQWRTLWYYRGDLEHTLAADRAALVAARHEGNAAAELQALWHLAHDETQVEAGEASGWQTQALALARDLGDSAALARSLARYGSDRGFLATPTERESALQALDQAVSLARQAGDPALLHHVLCELWGVGRLPQARAALEEALVLVRQLGDACEEVGTLAKLADLLARQGDFEAARAIAIQGWELSQRVDSPAYGAWNRRAWGQACMGLGDREGGLAHLRDAARIFEALSWQAMLAGSLLRLGMALHDAGETTETRAILERVLHLGQKTHEVYESACALAVLAELLLSAGEREAGRQALEEAAALVPQVGLPWHRAQTLLHLAAGWLELGEVAAARNHIEATLELAEAEDLRAVRAAALRFREKNLPSLGAPGSSLASPA